MPEPEEKPGRAAAEVAAAQARVAGRLLDVLLDPVQGDTYVRGVLPAPDGAPAVRVVTGKSPAGLEDAALWQVPFSQNPRSRTFGRTPGSGFWAS
ncbi:hypothetical protein ACFVDU_23390 [Streptomyces albidoflavus]